MRQIFEGMSNKEFALACINLLKEHKKLTEQVLDILTNQKECNDRFNCSGFPVLKQVPRDCNKKELRELCHSGAKLRYYQERIEVNGYAFVVTNHWYGRNMSMPDNRTPFLEWVISLIS